MLTLPVTPSKRGKGRKRDHEETWQCRSPAERRTAMTWAQRLKWVFNIDIKTCSECGSAVRIMPAALTALAGQALTCIEDPVVIEKILAYLDEKAASAEPLVLPQSREPPSAGLFD